MSACAQARRRAGESASLRVKVDGNGVNGNGVNGNEVDGYGVNGYGVNGYGVNGYGVNGYGGRRLQCLSLAGVMAVWPAGPSAARSAVTQRRP